MDALLGSLNPPQRKAVKTTEGPVLVLAGAGTGKTRTITVRVAWLLHRGVSPDSILAVTFTNKAAREMRQRVAALVGAERAAKLDIGTFHAWCVRALREHGAAIGIPPHFAICDQADQVAAVRGALRDLDVAGASIHPRALQAEISLRKNRLADPAASLEQACDDRDLLLARAWERYEDHLRRARSLDFDDLLLETLRLLRESPETADRCRERYRYLMVDEYQDTNRPQYEIVKALAGERRNLCVVGDDDQSIYGWRGADVRKILDFERDFSGCAVIRLETNYRSTTEILDAANRVIRCNPARHEKTLRSARGRGDRVKVVELDDEECEARAVVADLQKRVMTREMRYRDAAILFRTAVQPRPFEAALRERGVPYVLVGGQSFFDRKEVRDLLAFARLVANPWDEMSLLRVVNVPPRGVGKTTIERLIEKSGRARLSVPQILEGRAVIEDLPPAGLASIHDLRATLGRLREPEPGPRLVPWLRELIAAVDYRSEILRCYPEPRARDQRWQGVLDVIDLAENYVRREARPTLAGFLETLTLAAGEERESDDRAPKDAVTLMTLHAAKGLEFPRVYLVGCEEGLLPHLRSVAEEGIEEERRLMYVGITRAQRSLVVTHVRERARHGRRARCLPSRFLFEMQGEVPPDDWHPAGASPPSAAPAASPSKGKTKTTRRSTRRAARR